MAALKSEQLYNSRLEEMSRRRPIRGLLHGRRHAHDPGRGLIFVYTNILIDIATGNRAMARIFLN